MALRKIQSEQVVQTPTLIPAGDTFTVSADSQVLYAEPLTIDGTLVIDGAFDSTRVSTTIKAAGANGQIQFNLSGGLGATNSFSISEGFVSASLLIGRLQDDRTTTLYLRNFSNATISWNGVDMVILTEAANSNIKIDSNSSVTLITRENGTKTAKLDGSNGWFTVSGVDLQVADAGRGLQVKEGTNAKQGVATLVAGTVTVSNASVTANSRIFLTGQDDNGGTPGWLRVSARTVSTDFTITSSDVADTSIVAYEIFEPA